MSESAYTNTYNETLDSIFYYFYTVHMNSMHVWMSRDNRYQCVKLCSVAPKTKSLQEMLKRNYDFFRTFLIFHEINIICQLNINLNVKKCSE